MIKYYSNQYIAEVLESFSAIRKDGKRLWAVDQIRKQKVDYLTKIINPGKNDVILDVGCGLGVFISRCAKVGADCCGVDIAEKTIESARKFFSSQNISEKIKFYKIDAARLPYEDRFFNKVLAIDVLEHVSDFKKRFIIKEIGRVLKPDGILFLNTPNIFYLLIRTYFKKMFAILRFKSCRTEQIPHVPGSYQGSGEHIGLTNLFFLRNFLNLYGFRIKNIYYHPETKFDKYFFKIYSKIPFIRNIFIGSVTLKAKKV